MSQLDAVAYLRPCTALDDAFLHDVFATTWASEVAALPNQNLAQHVLRIQHIAQERRFAARFPGHERFVIVQDGLDVGRLYVHEGEDRLQILDLTLLPEARSHGLGGRVVRDLFAEAVRENRSVVIAVGRRNRGATDFAFRLGFRLTSVDDVDNHFEWSLDEATTDTQDTQDTQDPQDAVPDRSSCRYR